MKYFFIKFLINFSHLIIYFLILWGFFTIISKFFSIKNINIFFGVFTISNKGFQKESIISLVFWLILIAFTINSSIKIWSKRIDPELTIKALCENFAPEKLHKLIFLSKTIVEKPSLEITMETTDEHLIDFSSEQRKWSKADLEGKKQSIITITNKSVEDIENVVLALHFPFFVENQKVLEKENLSGDQIESNFTKWGASPGMTVELIGEKPRLNSCTIKIHNISKNGFLKILFVFDVGGFSVKDIPPSNSNMAKILKNSKCEFIFGKYTYKNKLFEIYYPIEINQDKSLYLGNLSNQIPPNVNCFQALDGEFKTSGNGSVRFDFQIDKTP